MERNLERYYTKFERPPFAPTYYPTEEEFSDPIAFVAKIKAEGEKYGLIKIVPPESFRPPFVIDSANFEFTPRVQKLNEIDAFFRVRIIFINKLVNFWHLQGHHFRLPWVENKYIDLYQLRKYVDEYGGLEKVNVTRKWSLIAKQLGFKNSSGASLKQNYIKWIQPYVNSVEKLESEMDAQLPSTSDSSILASDDASNGPSMQRQNRRRSTRMMAGVKTKPALPSLNKSSLPVEMVYCAKCDGGGDEDRLLLCETCDRSLHIYCLDPPLGAVPKGDWRCPQCVANAVKKVYFEFGFFDSKVKFNLNTFSEWANNFKQSYFKRASRDVSASEVENEFWKNVVNIDKDISVKYGADLITSKMGSGFPRKTDTFKGANAKERSFYANHPWNLNNLPVLRESVLSHINTDISGMMVPWVYVGMCFSTFCWHVEDHWTYSINYNHWGERKIWYGLSGDYAEKFDDFFRKNVPELFNGQVDLLHHMTTALNPRLLIDNDIPIYTVHQNPGEFVITFPRAYHSGYNEGLNFAEAVNFAPPDWLRMGRLCLSNYASVKRTCVFSHEELVMQMVKIANQMSIQMCLSTLEELRHIIARETEFRRRLTQGGLRDSEFRQFESISDDERSCYVCRTTLYISALVCRHRHVSATDDAADGELTLRIVCMEHINQLCDVCNLSDCTLIYRYSMEDFIPLAEKLSMRTSAFEEWRSTLTQMKKEDEKIAIQTLRSLVETWKSKHYPHCLEIAEIIDSINRFDKFVANVYKVINRKIRLRDNTRCKKVDNRLELSELERLRKELNEFNIRDEKLERSLETLCDNLTKWQTKARNLLASLENEYRDDKIADLILELIHEGEEFNFKLPEMLSLSKQLVYYQWLSHANRMIDWRNSRLVRSNNNAQRERRSRSKSFKSSGNVSVALNENDTDGCDAASSSRQDSNFAINDIKKMEDDLLLDEVFDEEEEDVEDENGQIIRFTIADLSKIINDAHKFTTDVKLKKIVRPKVAQLIQMKDEGECNEKMAIEFLSASEGVGFAKAEKIWLEHLQRTDWLDAESMNTFRSELNDALALNRQFSETIEEGANEQHDFSLKVVAAMEPLFERSLFERNGRLHAKLRDINARLLKFLERIGNMFQKPFGYYNIFELISGRDDLTALLEGDTLTRSLFKSTKYSDNWNQLKHYHTRDLLNAHLTAIYEQQLNLLMALRLVNARRSLKETCSCGGYPLISTLRKNASFNFRRSFNNIPNENVGSSSGQTTPLLEENASISCFVCNAAFHDTCAQWEPFLERLPEGIFLCPRCLRSRRPCIEDVEATCFAAPTRSLERLLITNLLERAARVFGDLQNSMHKLAQLENLSSVSDQQKDSIRQLIIMALSLEVMDAETYKITFKNIQFSNLFPISDAQLAVWRQIQSRMVESSPRRIIFPPPAVSPVSGGEKRSNNKRNNAGTLMNVSAMVDDSSASPSVVKQQLMNDNKNHTSTLSNPSTFEDYDTKDAKCENNADLHNGNDALLVGGKRRCREPEYRHNDEEFCAADKCLRPYSDQVRWIQCESGCMRWYHYVCVGQTVKGAQKLPAYTCYRCAADFANLSIAQ